MKSLFLVGFLYLTILNALAANATERNLIGQVVYSYTAENGAEYIQPWADVTVRLLDSDGHEVAKTKTNQVGNFSFKNVQTGRYLASTKCANNVDSTQTYLVGNSLIDGATFTGSPLRCGN